MQWKEGELVLGQDFSVALEGVKDARVDGAVDRFLARLGKRLGQQVSGGKSPDPAKATLRIETRHAGLPVQSYSEDESYALEVSPSQVRLSADNALGVLHGLETLLQLLEKRGKDQVLPAVGIQDTPRFRWRGLLIDVSRHFQPLEVLRRNIDGLAAAKMNVLHWHLSDDQGFRVESKRYPKLQGMGSDGNYYKQDEIRGLIAYARARGVRVVPEFDMPGHSMSWQAGYPELGSAPGPYQVDHGFSGANATFDPTREEVFTFIDGFLEEMAGLFPDAFMHIGGDENNGKLWNANPKIQAFMYKQGYRTNDELQAYFSGRVSKILTRHGKRMVGWDEILGLELPAGTVVHAWRSPELFLDSIRRGYDTILSNGYYLDLSQPASDHYLHDPMPADLTLTAEESGHVIGGEACMWSELVDQRNIDSRIWPRSLAVAERLWSPASVKELDDFYRRMDKVSVDLDELGLTHRSNRMRMLKSLAGGGDLQALLTLADAVAPLQYYRRHSSRLYNPLMPLDRLVDAVDPDTAGVRQFRSSVNALLAGAPNWDGSKDLELLLLRWKKNHEVLGPMLERSDRTVEAAQLSQDLSSLGGLGLEALQALKSGRAPGAAWQAAAAKTLARAEKPKAELELAVLPSLRKLVFAANQVEALSSRDKGAWNKDLDELVEKAGPKRDPW